MYEDKICKAIEGLSVKQAVEALVNVQYQILHQSVPSPTTPQIPKEPSFKPKSIKYDPLTDPAPPMDVDRVPERVVHPSRVLAKSGTACICNACRKVVFITNTDIKDGMKVSEFIEAFTPLEGMSKLAKTAEIQNIDGNIATDCPVCSAAKQLYLTGGPRA